LGDLPYPDLCYLIIQAEKLKKERAMTAQVAYLDIFKHLNKTNCKECGMPTCVAFAIAVSQGARPITGCPYVSDEAADLFAGIEKASAPNEDDVRDVVKQWQDKIKGIDLAQTAKRLDLPYKNGKLQVDMLGKPFYVNQQGEISANCHINPWLSTVLLSYACHAKGLEPKGEWVTLRQLPGGADWYRLFHQRGEKPLHNIVDNYFDMFSFMLDVFQAEDVTDDFPADLATIVYPVPKVPVLISYSKAEEGLDSNLNLLFDVLATENLIIDGIYFLAAGLVTMFERIAQTHGK
jgi:hypothetical protein